VKIRHHILAGDGQKEMTKRFPYIREYAAWSERYTNDPFSVPLTEWLARIPGITANHVTVLSFLCSLPGIWVFYLGGYENLVIGALIVYFSVILDGVDGKLARKLNQTSEFGRNLDVGLDKVRKLLILSALTYSSVGAGSRALAVVVLIAHYGLNYVTIPDAPRVTAFVHARGWKSLFDPIDAQLTLYFLGPVTNHVLAFYFVTVACQVAEKGAQIVGRRYPAHRSE
jgi:hypothetical protein